MNIQRVNCDARRTGGVILWRAIMDVELPRRITMDVNPLRSVIREMSPPRVTMSEVSPAKAGKEERRSPLRVTVREVSPPRVSIGGEVSPPSMGEVSPPREEASSPPRGGQGTIAMPPLLISNPARWVQLLHCCPLFSCTQTRDQPS